MATAQKMRPRNDNGFKHDDAEYRARRQQDEARTRIVEQFMDDVYAKNGYNVTRISNPRLQKQGVDIIHVQDGEERNVDEKYAINYYNKDLRTFSFELYSRNNRDNNGWFTADHIITDDYAILWFSADDDFKEITQYDLCIIPKEAILDLVYDAGYYDEIVDDFLRYWEYRQYINHDEDYYEKGEGKGLRRYLQLDFGIRICQSVGLHEQPINIVIPKDELVRLATYRYRGHAKK